MLLTVNATFGAAWCCRWLCRKITEKVPSATIVLRNYQSSQMPSSREPHMALNKEKPHILNKGKPHGFSNAHCSSICNALMRITAVA